jgi:hypothetical protein
MENIMIVEKSLFSSPNPEILKFYLQYSKKLKTFQKEIPIDIIVHTQKMYHKLKDLNSGFYKHTIKRNVENIERFK